MRVQICIRSIWVWVFTCALSLAAMKAQEIKPPRGRFARVAVVQNSNPNYAAVREYGRIEWHGDTARLIAASSRPLDMAALTISSCLGVSVSSEDPQYRNLGDLLDVTAPQWSAQHPDSHVYAGRPGKVEVTFDVLSDGSPRDIAQLLDESVCVRSTSNCPTISSCRSEFFRIEPSTALFLPRREMRMASC
jgi:hypothetical protein